MSTAKLYSQKICSDRSGGKLIINDYNSAAVSIIEYHFIVKENAIACAPLRDEQVEVVPASNL